MFAEWKEKHMKKLVSARKKGLVDDDIVELINVINKCEEYYTTSSCSGRIVLLTIPKSGKKNDSEFLFKKHSPTQNFWDKLVELTENCSEEIWFRMEGLILHVGCKDLLSAQKLLSIARNAGLKKSVIFNTSKQFIVEIQSSERIDAIVGGKGFVWIDKKYFELLLKKANNKLKQVKEKNKKLLELLKKELIKK